MDAALIQSALADITAEQDPTLKSLKLASLCSTLWAERGVESVVVGGSAIELITDGAYASGDLDMCHTNKTSLPIRERQEVMAQLRAEGGPRNWQVAGMYFDLLGPAESCARTPFRKIEGPYGSIWVMKVEDLLVERVLVSVYPQPHEPARVCAKALAAVGFRRQIEIDWPEVRWIALLPEYRNLDACKALVVEVAHELKIKNPFDSD